MTGGKPTVAALLETLRQASSTVVALRIIDEAIHLLVATFSLAEAQNLVFGLQQCIKTHRHSIELTESLHEKLQQAAAICNEPVSKAEFLGFVLFQQCVSLLKTHEVSALRAILYKTLHTNHNVLSGYLAALTAADGPIFSPQVDIERVKKTLELYSPIIKSVLIDSLQSDGRKTSVLAAMASITWQFDDNITIQTAATLMLVEALELVPQSQLTQVAYTAHVALVVDILTSFSFQSKENIMLAARTARFVLVSVQLLIEKDVGVLALLQYLKQLARNIPEALWCSEFLTLTAYFLTNQCKTFFEHQLMLKVLHYILQFERNERLNHLESRSVYVEILVLPLSSLLKSHGRAATELLQQVIVIQSKGAFQYKQSIYSNAPLTESAAHARLAVQLISDEESCQRWLDSLFSSEDSALSMTVSTANNWLALILVALLSDPRSSIQNCAEKCLERQVRQSPKFWDCHTTNALVASILFLVSQQKSVTLRSGQWMTSCLYSLAGLAATTTETMRIILRLIDQMNHTVNMRSTAIMLLYQVYLTESRTFPRLETMLLEPSSPDDDLERHIIRMSLIKRLCEKDSEVGVQFVSIIQGYLEDELESVASMAMDAITALCQGDCLDFYVAFRIIAQKVRKNKICCADKPLFQERLCVFYSNGCVDYTGNERYTIELLRQTWEFVENEFPNVRKAAYAAMNKFPLQMVGLCVPPDNIDEQEGEDGHQTLEEKVEEQCDKLMRRLESENDTDVRLEIETLISKVIEHEGMRLSVVAGRGQRRRQDGSQQMTSIAFVSAAATKELKTLFPSSAEVQSKTSSYADVSGYLMTYEPKALVDMTLGKRKDKLVRLATKNVQEILETVTQVLNRMNLPWESSSKDANDWCGVYLSTHALMEGWWRFMATYLSALDVLTELKTPAGVDDADVAFRVFTEQVTLLLDLLLCECPNKIGGQVAAGALIGQMCSSKHWKNPQLRQKCDDIIHDFSRKLALSIEQSRVFSSYESDDESSKLGVLLAIQLSLGRRKTGSREDDASFYHLLEEIQRLFKNVSISSSDDLVVAFAVLGLSHVATLYMNGEELESSKLIHWRQHQVKLIADHIFERLFGKMQHNLPEETIFPSSIAIESTTFESSFNQSSPHILVQWASFTGLARLASGFSSIQRVDWLNHVQNLLISVWKSNTSANVTAIALGPVLLHCVHHNLVQSASLEQFVADAIERAATSNANSLDRGFLMMSVAHILCRVDSFGGFRSATQKQTKSAIQQISKGLEHDSIAMRSLMLMAIANFFYLPFGMSGSFVTEPLNVEGCVELKLDSETVSILVHAAQVENNCVCSLSYAVVGAIARAAERFYVVQKKKLFDAEIRTLPIKSMSSKALQWLWSTDPSSLIESENTSKIRNASSLLRCLTSTGQVLPLLDFTSFVQSVMLRFSSVDVSVACVEFAATQASCDKLVANELLSLRWFGNADATLQAALIMWVPHAATRVETDMLRRLLTKIFHYVRDLWCHDISSKRCVLLFDSWTAMLHNILKPNSCIPEMSMDMAKQFILDDIVNELPLEPHGSHLIEQFTSRVLSELDYGERGFADIFLLSTKSDSFLWSWWQKGVIFVNLAKLKRFTISKREASLVFQWILRHSFNEWSNETLVNAFLEPLLAEMGALIAQNTNPNETVSSLLDVIDAFSRDISAFESSVYADAVKERALFGIMVYVLIWNVCTMHEQYQLLQNLQSDVFKMHLKTELLPFGVIMYAHGSKAASAVGERLLALLNQLVHLSSDELTEYLSALHKCTRQMHVAADKWCISSTLSDTIRKLWSLRETNSWSY
ncbi:hypothetical protein Plhal304r1_c003g0010971 [Plasmopara halstedii]